MDGVACVSLGEWRPFRYDLLTDKGVIEERAEAEIHNKALVFPSERVVGALTVTRPKRLRNTDPRVVHARTQEFGK